MNASISNNMVNVSKFGNISILWDTGLFEVGINQIESIDVDKEIGIIEIKFENDSKWKYQLIQFRNVKKLVYNEWLIQQENYILIRTSIK